MNFPKKASGLGLLASALATPLAAYAQQNPTVLPDVVVTATRIETRSDALISDVTVIRASELEQQSGRTVSEVLTRLAGVQMSATGGPGSNSSLFVRGTNSSHVLLLVDGLRVGSATTGTANFDNIPLDSIERIEVLSGPASALYGSSAVGGVVQIFTKKGAKGFTPNAAVTLGSNSYRSANAGVAGTNGGLRYALGMSERNEKGFSATKLKANELYEFYKPYNPDRDPYRQSTAYLNLGLDVATGWTLDTQLSAANGQGHWDDGESTADPSSALNNRSRSVAIKGQISPDWSTRLQAGQTIDKGDFTGTTYSFFYETHNNQLSWTNEIKTSLGTVLAGFDQQNERINASDDYKVKERTLRAGFVGLTGSSQGHGWQLNLRRDNNSQFGSASTGYAGYSYKWNSNWRAAASVGTSFNAPSFVFLYDKYTGNPNLVPEKGRSADLNVTYNRGPHEVKLTRYINRVRDLIVSSPPTYVGYNVAVAHLEGWTLAYSSEIGELRLRSTLHLLDARNANNNNWLPLRARQQFNLGLDTQLGVWTVGGDLLAVSKRYQDPLNTKELAGYATLDLFASRRISQDWVAAIKVNNLANKEYETSYGYNQPGRNVFVSLRYQPK